MWPNHMSSMLSMVEVNMWPLILAIDRKPLLEQHSWHYQMFLSWSTPKFPICAIETKAISRVTFNTFLKGSSFFTKAMSKYVHGFLHFWDHSYMILAGFLHSKYYSCLFSLHHIYCNVVGCKYSKTH